MTQSHRSNFLVSAVVLVFITNHHEISCEASIQVHHQSNPKDYHVNNLPQERIDEQKATKDQTIIVRLPSNTLLKYTAYKDVSILHFRIPADTRTAFFTFKAFEESKSTFQRKCKPRDVTLHLKASSYPVISPENITFPRNFLNADQRFKIYNLQFQSDEIKQHITIEGPQVGNWFAVAFVSWTDPNNDRIEQQGLAASCDTLLMAELSVTRFDPVILNNGQLYLSHLTEKLDNSITTENRNETQPPTTSQTAEPIPADNANSNKTAHNENIYKFYVPPNICKGTARIAITKACALCPDIGVHIQPNAFPYSGDPTKTDHSVNIHTTIIKPNQTGEISVEFYVQQNCWHYALVNFVNATELPAPLQTSNIRRDNKLKMMPSDMLFQSVTTGSSNNFRRQNNFDVASEVNEALWYSLEYELQIYYHESSHEGEQSSGHSASKANKSTSKQLNPTLNDKNETTNAHNKATNEKQSSSWRPVLFRDMEFYPLLRQTYREFFMFDYDLVPDENGTVPTVLNLTAGTPSGFAFEIGEVYDIGGTLCFAVSMKHSEKDSSELKSMPSMTAESERSGILAEKLIGHPLDAESNLEDNDKALSRSNQTIIVCMHLGEPGEPMWPDKCRYRRKILPASSIVNNTDSNTSTGLIHVPFPESGQWYVTMGLYCHGAETAARVTIIDSVKEFVRKYANMLETIKAPCACASGALQYQTCVGDRNCLASMNETETLKIKECLMDSKCTANYMDMTRKFDIHHKSATEQHFALDNCNTSIVFTVSSSPCVAGRCGRFGRCYHYMSGGFVFSTCVCMKGYRGWDCTEDTQVPSSMSILLALLFLTLSNLLFIPSIYMAIRRKYYTEAVIYFFAMFFSIFYHACDSGEDEYSFCLVKIGVLQFCDFYCGLLAIWVTLVAMSHVRQQCVSLLHMFGAILLAFGTELNKQSLWVFLAPALTGICLISASWGLRCYKSRKWFPTRKYLTVYMPLGMVLVMVGLVCYAFLQTKQNYHIVHSIWHMVMALSILCLLPSRKSFIPKC